jgi:ABC-type antimicrobial peptide transport system permease subunit
MDGTSNQGTEHVQNWLKKLKESQDRKKDEKIRRYNDVVSRLIILLIGVCIVCVIVIAALIVQNEGQKKNFDQMVLTNKTNFEVQQAQINALNGDIQDLQADNERYRNFILMNRTLDIDHYVNVDPSYPNVTRITYNNTQITLYFIDGTSKTTNFASVEFNI